MLTAKILDKIDRTVLMVECPSCEEQHRLTIMRSDVKENHFDVMCFGCMDNFEVKLDE